MKRTGWILLALGLASGLVSLWLFFKLARQLGPDLRVAQLPIPLGEPLRSPVIEVDTSQQVALGIKLWVSSQETRERSGDEEELDLRYSFPFRYRVTDEAGRELASQVTAIAHDVTPRRPYDRKIGPAGGTSRVDHRYDLFTVPPPGRIVVEARVDPDSTYRAEVLDMKLEVYDRAEPMLGQGCGGVGGLLLAILLTLTGVILLAIAYARRG
jgi:hypothetical protein